MDNNNNKVVRRLFYYGPLFIWAGLALLLATSFGSYTASVSTIYAVLAFLSPETSPPTVDSIYGLTYIVRRSAYILEYGVFALLLVRAVQQGAPRLLRRSVVAMFGISILFVLIDNGVRLLTPGRHGGWDDVLLSLANIALFTGLIYFFFAIKYWERNHFLAETQNTVQ